MGNLSINEVMLEALNELEANGDIVISTTVPNVIVDKLIEACKQVSPISLSEIEFSAVKNAVNATCNGTKLDDSDFQTHIGLTKEELKVVAEKLGKAV
ncbi:MULTISPECIES: hypothetical protein [Vibrio]|uniref:Uncharacterized protein n=2 Tax=Vibrio proteolyticus TaxID=671 RepID=U3A452_VIBPR|nr:hypothetical protein [Vibrio parahaemolyticus]GAD68475.1 hypothetical protein VPR01S_14_00010 [Vibrio proteolyticus NBRC 13287]